MSGSSSGPEGTESHSTNLWRCVNGMSYISSTVAASPSSANDYLLTVLGEFVLPEHEPVWTSTLVDALAVLDIGEPSARQALNRADARGLIRGERVGRRTRWQLTDRA